MTGTISFRPRETEGTTTWHLCWQAAQGRDFVASRLLCERIRDRIIGAHRERGRVLVDYLITPAEIHSIVAIRAGDSCSSIAHGFGNIVARWMRADERMRYPVFAGRFMARRIVSDADQREDIRMLAWRPVFIGLRVTPSHHAHGGLRAALGRAPPQGFDTRALLALFGDDVPSARTALRAWTARRPAAPAVRTWELSRGLCVTGSPALIGPLPHEVGSQGVAGFWAAAAAGGVDEALRLLTTWVSARRGLLGQRDGQPFSASSCANGRALVACLAVDHGLCSAAAVARHYGRAKSTLSEQMAACRKRQEDRSILALPSHRIVEEMLLLAPGQADRRGR